MGRIRSIHPDACASETLARLTASEERTFYRLLTYCDDFGRALANPKLIKAAIYPLHDDMSPIEVAADLQGLAAAGVLRFYTVDGKAYLTITSWGEYQHPQKPSKSKFPPYTSAEDAESALPHSDSSIGRLSGHSSSAPVPLHDYSSSPLWGPCHGEGVGEGEGGTDSAPQPPAGGGAIESAVDHAHGSQEFTPLSPVFQKPKRKVSGHGLQASTGKADLDDYLDASARLLVSAWPKLRADGNEMPHASPSQLYERMVVLVRDGYPPDLLRAILLAYLDQMAPEDPRDSDAPARGGFSMKAPQHFLGPKGPWQDFLGVTPTKPLSADNVAEALGRKVAS